MLSKWKASVKIFLRKSKGSDGAAENITKNLGVNNFWDQQYVTRIRFKDIL